MSPIGVMVYAGIESYMSGMTNAADKFYLENNLQDLNVLGTSFLPGNISVNTFDLNSLITFLICDGLTISLSS